MHDLSLREAVRIELTRSAVGEPDALERAFLQAARVSAQTLQVSRVGVWFFEDEGKRIRCRYLYERAQDAGAAGEVLELSECRAYGAALHSYRSITAHAARSDPRTVELLPYLEKYDIFAMLDSPVFENGVPVGILCHEHAGAAREWTREEAHFAATIADMLGLYLEQAKTQETFRALLKTRAQLEEAQVMESIGRMAAGVAHDFNNVLTAIGLWNARGEKPMGFALDGPAVKIQALVEQGSRLVQQLMSVAQRESLTPHNTDLGEAIAGLLPFFRTLERDGILVELAVPSVAVSIPLERSRAEQVLTNLAVNARDSMLGGGTLSVSAGIREDAELGQPIAFLRVLDTGVGMDEATRARIFEPYFTTKPRGQGVGLGLSTVYRIVKDSGGSVAVTSALGAGTEFRLEWPAVAAP